MGFPLTPRSTTLTCYKFEFSQNFVGISQIWEPTTAERMKIDRIVSDGIVAY